MNKRKWNGFNAALAAWAGFVASALVACSGDDTAVTPNVDAAVSDSATTHDASGSSSSDAAAEASAGDSSTREASAEASAEASIDSGADAALPPIVALDLCPVFDVDWGLATDVSTDVSVSSTDGGTVTDDDRDEQNGGWDFNGFPPFGSVPLTFGEALTGDCELTDLVATLDADAGYGAAEYLNQIAAFTLQFLGCPLTDDAGAPSFTGLMPATALPPNDVVWTQADLDYLAKLYSDALVQSAATGWAYVASFNGPPLPVALTDDQISAIDAQLSALEAQAVADHLFTVDTITPTALNFSTCSAGDAGAEDAGDAGHD